VVRENSFIYISPGTVQFIYNPVQRFAIQLYFCYVIKNIEEHFRLPSIKSTLELIQDLVANGRTKNHGQVSTAGIFDAPLISNVEGEPAGNEKV